MRVSLSILTSPARAQASAGIAAVLILFVVATRMPALLHPRAIDDEQIYAVVATTMIHGGQPYVDAVERKPPLLFDLYEVILRAAGERNWAALHVTAAIWTLATMAALAAAAYPLFGWPAAGWAALLYGVFVAWGDYRALALNGELLMNLPLVIALAIAFRPTPSKLRPDLALAGVLVGVASLLKQPAAIALLPLGLYVLRADYRAARGLRRRHSIAHASWICGGFIAALAVMSWTLWRQQIWQNAFYWAFLSHEIPLRFMPGMFLRNGPGMIVLFIVTTFPLVYAAARSIADGRRSAGSWAEHGAEFAGLLMFLVAAFIGVAVNGQFLPHYFLQLIPPLALLAAPVFATTWAGVGSSSRRPVGRAAVAASIVLAALTFFIIDTIGLARNRPASDAGRYVQTHSLPEDRIFVWGQSDGAVGIYLDAARRPASRFLASYPLTGHIFSYDDNASDEFARVDPGMWPALAHDFAIHPPRFVIDADIRSVDASYPIGQYPFLRDYLNAGYDQVYGASDGIVYLRRPSMPAGPLDR